MRITRPALCLALAGVAASGSFAFAVEAPKSSPTSKTLYLAQEGCGTTAEAGRLETSAGVDGATGCGTIGGIPIEEAIAQLDGGSTLEDFTSTAKLTPFKIDATKKVTGQLAAASWVGNGSGGLGSVQWDYALIATTTTGKTIDFGSGSMTATATPGTDVVEKSFELAIPGTAAGQTIKSLVFSYALRGANVGMSAHQYDGHSYIVIPAKAK